MARNHQVIFVFLLSFFFILPAAGHSADCSLDVVFVLDTSGSMGDPCVGASDKIACLKEGAKTLIDAPKMASSRLGIFTFDATVHKIANLTAVSGNQTALKANIDSLTLSEHTALGDGLHTALDYLDANGAPGKKGIVILFTDGYVNSGILNTSAKVLNYIKNNWQDGPFEIYTVGTGADIDADMLQNISDYTNGRFYQVDTSCDGSCISNTFLDAMNLACAVPLRFIPPTAPDNYYVSRDWAYVAVAAPYSIMDTTAFIDWNNSLVGWWRFNRESGESTTLFRDWSGYGNDGICNTTTCPNYTYYGKFGKALQFDGIDDNITISDSPSLDSIAGAFTVELWMSISRYKIRDYLVHKQDDSPGIRFDDTTTDYIQFCYNTTACIKANQPVGLNTWTHVAFTWNSGTGAMYGYINGKRVAQAVIPNSWFVPGGRLMIGGDGSASRYHNGSIDEVRIFKRALSPEEINASYNAELYLLYSNFTSLAEGIYTYTAYTQDLAGNVDLTETRIVTIDQTQPFIVFEPPTDPDNYVANRNWTYINTTASDNLSPKNITAFIDFNNSLVGWWRFNGEPGENSTLFRDWSQHQNNGTCSGTNCPSRAFGQFGYALQFDGIDDNITISDSPSLDSIAGAFTVELWMSISRYKIRDYLVHKQDDSPGIRFDDTNTAYLQFCYNATACITANQPVGMNRWAHVAFTWDSGTGTIYGYLNGNRVAQAAIQKNWFVPGGRLMIGGDGDGSRYHNGSIDEVRIFKRALSPEEINASFNAGIYRLNRNFTKLNDSTYTYTAYVQDLAGNVNQTETRVLIINTVILPFTNQSVSILPLSNDVTLPLGGAGRWVVKVKNLQPSDNIIELTLTSNSDKLRNWIWFEGHRYDAKKNKITIILGPNEERAISVNIFGGEVMSSPANKIKVSAKSLSSGSESEAQADVFIISSDDGITVRTPEIGWSAFAGIAAIGALMLFKAAKTGPVK